MEHDFTSVIKGILQEQFGDKTDDLFEKSPLLQYINLKTLSATRGSKARSSFANLYAIYVLVEDYTRQATIRNTTVQNFRIYSNDRENCRLVASSRITD